MNAPFEDLCITGLISERCYPVEGSSLRIHLELSQSPPLGWAYLFSQVWQAVEYPGKCPVGIEGGAIWIECAPDEVRTAHLPWLEWAIEQTCERYFAHYEQKRIAIERQRELSRQTHMKLEELANSFVPAQQAQAAEEASCEPITAPSGFGRVGDFLRRALAMPAKKLSEERNTHGLEALESAALRGANKSGHLMHLSQTTHRLTQHMMRPFTFWIWLSLGLLFSLAGYVLHEWLYLIQASGYMTDYPAPHNAAIQRAHFARLGLAILLPPAIASYFRKPSPMSLWVRWPYLCAIGLAVAVFVIFWTTKFRYW